MPKLTVKSPEFAGRVFQLDEASISLGRSDDNTLILEHPSVSSNHAELKLEGGDYKVVDLGSTNGTRVNDERITETILRNQDVVMFGNIVLTYESESGSAAAPMPAAENKVDLSATGGGRPQVFKNLAPFPKSKDKASGPPVLIIIAVLVALAGGGFYVFSTFLS